MPRGSLPRTIEHVNDLPSDPARLRAILAYLDQAVADNETVGIYLRIQRDTVHKALTQTEDPPPKHHGRLPKGGANLPALAPPTAQTGYVVQHRRSPQDPGPAVIHVDDCTTSEGTTSPISSHDARVALTDPSTQACASCRPDSALGILD